MMLNRLILKSISHLLLGVMVYMHVCSAWCAVMSNNCCSEAGNHHCAKSMVKHKSFPDGKNGDCQDYHLSFFNAAGQFGPEKAIDVNTVLPFVVPEVPQMDMPVIFATNLNPVAFNNFHPPPPISDIRVFIQSFQI